MRKQLFVIAAILLFGLITACDATPGNDPFENADSQESFGDESDGIESEDLGVDEGSTLETCEDPIEWADGGGYPTVRYSSR